MAVRGMATTSTPSIRSTSIHRDSAPTCLSLVRPEIQTVELDPKRASSSSADMPRPSPSPVATGAQSKPPRSSSATANSISSSTSTRDAAGEEDHLELQHPRRARRSDRGPVPRQKKAEQYCRGCSSSVSTLSTTGRFIGPSRQEQWEPPKAIFSRTISMTVRRPGAAKLQISPILERGRLAAPSDRARSSAGP